MIMMTVPISMLSHRIFDETGHPILSLKERQWKTRRQHDQKFPMKGKTLQNKN